MPRTFSGRRCAAGSVSGSTVAATRSSPPASTTSAANTHCHEACSSTAAPSDGARTGATPRTSISRDITVAAAVPENKSPMTAIATTVVAAAPMPCSPRATPSTVMSGASMHSTDASMCSTIPAINGRRRPSESDSGPTTSWPSANPARVPVSVSCATDDDTLSSSAMLGRAGRYMSIVSGPSATREPSTKIICARLGATATGVLRAGVSSTCVDVAMDRISESGRDFLPPANQQ